MTPTGVLLMTYGSASNADEVPEYLRSVRGGGDPSPELVAEFRRRYEVIGWSPLVRITRAQAAALQALLDGEHGPGRYRVEVGMLHAEPRIAGALERLAAAGARRVVAVVLAPQWSPHIMGGYERAVRAAVERLRGASPAVELTVMVAGPWHQVPAFLDSLAERVRQGLDRLGEGDGGAVPVIFTAHSLPKVVVDKDPGYITQLTDTVDAIVARLGLPAERWRFAYQSAGHTPQEWLKPDLKDLLPGLRAEGASAVLVAPVQFLADHLEILFDIDVAAREEAEEAGLAFHRIDMPNDSPALVRALAEVVELQERASLASS